MSETKSQQTNDSNNNRVWFVTGASSGFGRAISSAALERGDRVVATARDTDSVAELTERGDGRALALELDVTDAEAARAAFDEAVSRFGRVDVVVNNAGYGHIGAVEELTDAEWHQQLDVNLFGVINVTRAALPQLRKQRSGHLVQMSSLNGVEGLPGGAYYSASKFAVEGLSESLADEVGHLGIDVTIVEPGPHRTRFASDRSTKQADAIEDYAPSVGQTREAVGELDGNQPGDPERAARAIIDAVEAEDPPRRLALGHVAVDNIRAKLNAQLSELDEWAAVSASSDYPEEDEAG
jgi:NAD(P)-dependent dehydrogenase (short-subunit alcohol dehydrogenase family)